MDLMQAIKKFDKSDYFGFLNNFSNQISEAIKLELPKNIAPGRRINNVALLGMGGSAIGGDFLRDIYIDSSRVPIRVIRGYTVPGWVNGNTLVIASSYSGNTEETISAYDHALSKGSYILSITTGGKLRKKTEEDGFPVISLPEGYQPRAAIGLSLIPMLRIMNSAGLINIPSLDDDIRETISLIAGLNKKYSPSQKNESLPLRIAREMNGKLPVIYTGPSPMTTLGKRFRGQLSENSKILAYCAELPEMNHNEIMGWDAGFSLTKEIYVLFLRDTNEHERVRVRMEITKGMISELAGGCSEVWSSGKSALARIMSLLFLGDYTSFYLALLREKDPTVIGNITSLKKKMSE